MPLCWQRGGGGGGGGGRGIFAPVHLSVRQFVTLYGIDFV